MDAVVIMAKEPKVGEVKTRLVPPLTPEEAARLYHNFLLDKVAQLSLIPDIQHCLAYYPRTARDFFQDLVPSTFMLIEQVGPDLGERLKNVSSHMLDRNFDKILMIDSDTPNLPTSYLTDALSALENNDAVLGPCEDGGYYLIGIKTAVPGLFRGIPWSTPDVNKVTLQRAEELGISIEKLATWFDVDTIAELERLKNEIEASRGETTREFFCANTYDFLVEFFK